MTASQPNSKSRPAFKPWHEDNAFWHARDRFMFSANKCEQAIAELDCVLALLQAPAGASILDLCCGPGRHCVELARRGYAVTAVDRTAAFLDRARRHASQAGFDVEIVQDDMRRFCRPTSFDAAINLFTSFGYFDDPDENRQVLVNLHQSLRVGGRLVMEMAGKEILARIFQPRGWDEQDGVFLLGERTVERDWSWMKVREIYIDGTHREEHVLEHRLYSAAELKGLLVDVGFADVQIFGSLDATPYDQNAKRLVAVARK
jgi:SAM-dependent methyltransferase